MFKLFEIIKQEDAKELNRLKKELKQTTQRKWVVFFSYIKKPLDHGIYWLGSIRAKFLLVAIYKKELLPKKIISNKNKE